MRAPPPSPTPAPTTNGALSRGEVLQVLNGAQGRVQRCFERGLRRDPNLGGRIDYRWTIDERGRVREAQVESSTLGDPPTERCILGVLRSLRFPAPEGGSVSVTFPYMFQRAP